MTYLSLPYYILVLVTCVIYYVLPQRFRWVALLASNLFFYGYFFATGWWIFALTVAVAYGFGLFLSSYRTKVVLFAGIGLVILPWILGKTTLLYWIGQFSGSAFSILVPMGISFYTMQLVSYLADVYMEKIKAEENPFRFLLFATFFPQVVQGPIPRYDRLAFQLYEGHAFDEERFRAGVYRILWGFFLKLVIADKAAVVVNRIFDHSEAYGGSFVWIAGILYSLQLYTDFLACTTLAQGVAELFGVSLEDNFARPYFAVSIKDFWRRWHQTLSGWLRDYIYIPLGGNRKGKVRKNVNIMLTFAVSGLWHGAGMQFFVWGLLHGLYQLTGDLLSGFKTKVYDACGIAKESHTYLLLKRIGTFFWVMLAWILFRASSLATGLSMIRSMFTVWNPWIFFDGRIFELGLAWKEWGVLVFALLFVHKIHQKQEQGFSGVAWIGERKLLVRYGIFIVGVLVVMVFGTYGFGFDAQDFIYGGF